jgi:carbon monoxide dehydrogenase subunit G
MQPRHSADAGLSRLSAFHALGTGSDRHQKVFVLSLSRMAQVNRDPDLVFRQLHDPEMLLGCVPGAGLTRVIDAERFEGRIVIGAGPFRFAYHGEGRIIDSDPKARTASLRLRGLAASHVPTVRVLMSMAVHGDPRGSLVHMSFWVSVLDRSGLLSRGWVDPIAYDLLDRTVRRIKRQLEAEPGPTAA